MGDRLVALQFEHARERVEKLLRVNPQSKPAVYMQIFDATDPLSLNYLLEIVFSAGIATLGLVLNSPAVVIGAMLISPLMGPILAVGLSLAASDLYLGLRSYFSLLSGILVSLLFSAVVVWLLPFQQPTSEILARTAPNLLDLGVALLSGLAGSVVLCRGGGGGGVTALPGVAIAVALMPPLCTVGFGIGSGWNWEIISGAALLFLTNLAAISASAFAVFWIVNMDSRKVREIIDAALLERSRSDWLYPLLQRLRLAPALGHIGKLRWRILMLVFILLLIGRPLLNSLNRVKEETTARAAVRDVVRSLVAADDILLQETEITAEAIRVRLFLAGPLPAGKREEAERELIRRTGREAAIVVQKVAREDEIAALRESLRRPQPPAVQPVDDVRRRLHARLQAALQEFWPASAGEIRDSEIGFRSDAVVVRIRFVSDEPFTESSRDLLRQALNSRLQAELLALELEREPKSPPPQRRSRR